MPAMPDDAMEPPKTRSLRAGKTRRAVRTAPSTQRQGEPNLRERNKLRKEQLIREAARSLFAEKGFAGTTLREVAERAQVGFGTVFAYAADKNGLLAMAYVEELTALPSLFEDAARRADPLDELIQGLSRLYGFWAKIPKLSHHVLQQMEFYGENPHMDVILARRQQARGELGGWVARLQEQGRLACDVNAVEAADTLFAIYTSAVREWSATTPDDVPAGLARLRQLMRLPMRALISG